MLILSRRKDETFVIGDDIEVTVLEIKGSTIKLGIIAPKNVEVHRAEIYERIKQADCDQDGSVNK